MVRKIMNCDMFCITDPNAASNSIVIKYNIIIMSSQIPCSMYKNIVVTCKVYIHDHTTISDLSKLYTK